MIAGELHSVGVVVEVDAAAVVAVAAAAAGAVLAGVTFAVAVVDGLQQAQDSSTAPRQKDPAEPSPYCLY